MTIKRHHQVSDDAMTIKRHHQVSDDAMTIKRHHQIRFDKERFSASEKLDSPIAIATIGHDEVPDIGHELV